MLDLSEREIISCGWKTEQEEGNGTTEAKATIHAVYVGQSTQQSNSSIVLSRLQSGER
jgi:hypothetical protein